ncbi:DUF4296 domain-containing protein [Namhaeicola litoreus]|uniref:DUF4296 domain-containing protein n=1 Tax=Namhaeicola litoreus TaxID=1052145 RepID=A0ABW3XZH0_9FLAO
MKINPLTFLLFVLILACQGKTHIPKPENLIPPEKMENLLYDMYVANGAVSAENKNGDKNIKYMSFISLKYQIDSVQFAISNEYYTSQVDEYRRILENVKKRLEEDRELVRFEMDSIRGEDESVPEFEDDYE